MGIDWLLAAYEDARAFGSPRVRLELGRASGGIRVLSERWGGVLALHAEMLLRLRLQPAARASLDAALTEV